MSYDKCQNKTEHKHYYYYYLFPNTLVFFNVQISLWLHGNQWMLIGPLTLLVAQNCASFL